MSYFRMSLLKTQEREGGRTPSPRAGQRGQDAGRAAQVAKQLLAARRAKGDWRWQGARAWARQDTQRPTRDTPPLPLPDI